MEKTHNSPIYFVYDTDIIFEEKGNSCSCLREIQWAKSIAEKDKDRAKLEIRKWYITPEGERAGKGFTFQTEEGPSELTKVLVENGYGDTKELLNILKDREDFEDSVNHLYDEDLSESDGEFFDPREVLLVS